MSETEAQGAHPKLYVYRAPLGPQGGGCQLHGMVDGEPRVLLIQSSVTKKSFALCYTCEGHLIQQLLWDACDWGWAGRPVDNALIFLHNLYAGAPNSENPCEVHGGETKGDVLTISTGNYNQNEKLRRFNLCMPKCTNFLLGKLLATYLIRSEKPQVGGYNGPLFRYGPLELKKERR